MKTKEKQRKYYIYTVAAAFLALVLSVFCPVLTAEAEEMDAREDILAENYNMCEEYSMLLVEECNRYSSLDSSPQKQLSKSVVNLVNAYRKQLLDLQSHPDASRRLLTKEIKLAYAKGCAAGRLGWIYHYNYTRLSLRESQESVTALYTSLSAEIDSATDAAVLTAGSDGIAAEINREIYLCLLCELALPDDSLASASVIAGGIASSNETDSSDLFAYALEEIYGEVKHSLLLQRSRDALTEEMRAIFKIILPGADYSSDKTVALFTYKLKNATSISEMNSAICDTLCTLLSVGESRIYASEYRASLKEQIADITLKASTDGRHASLSYLFEDFSELSARADTKDEIRALLLASGEVGDELLIELEKQFNAAGGLVEVAQKDLLRLELTRAEAIKKCISACRTARDELDVILAPYDPSFIKEEISALLEKALAELFALEGYESFAEACDDRVSKTEASVESFICEAKAERYLLDHKAVIQKPSELLSLEDELALRRAVSDYSALETKVREALLSQINSITEKYNNVLSQIIRSKMADDALYLDLCESICKELKELSKINIDEYYNNCDRLLKKADTLCGVVRAYRSICAEELYSSFKSSERESLVSVCRTASDQLSALSPEDIAIFEDELSAILENARLSMSRVFQTVRIRVAARESENAEINTILSEASAKIKSSYDAGEMISTADKAIFKINRLLTVDRIAFISDENSYQVGQMKFLTADEKTLLKDEIASLRKSFSEEAAIAENITVLKFIWEGFCERLEETYARAEKTDLDRSLDEHLEMLKKETAALSAELRTMVHLTEQKCEEYLNKVLTLKTTFSSGAVSLRTSEEVEALYATTLENLNSIRICALGENLENYKIHLLGELTLLGKVSENYSAENYNKVLEITEQARATLPSLSSIAECNSLLEEVKKKIALVDTLLDEAKYDAITKLDALASTYRSQAELYSSASLSSIEEILSEGKRQINAFSHISEIDALKELLAERLALLRSVKKDYITSSPNGLDFTAAGAEYPLQYRFSEGYWGLLYSPGAIPSDAKLGILPNTVADLSEIERLIRGAAKKDTVKYLGTVGDDLRGLLKRGSVALALDVSLENAEDLKFPVTLQMLLPAELASENLLGVAFICEDGSVEFYSAERKDMLISLSMTHFSSYYLIMESTVNLLPLIIILSVLIIFELLVFGLLVFIRYNRKRKEADAMFPILPTYLFLPFSAAIPSKVKPSGAVGAVVLLSVAALALGCGIAILLRAELKESKTAKAKTQTSNDVKKKEKEQDKLKGADRPMLRAKVYRLDAPKKHESEADEFYENSEHNSVLCAVGGAQSTEEELEYTASFEGGERHDGKRYKCEVNLDVIESCFDAGDLVTLEALKQKRIAPRRADYVKILARGALSKPLIIEAHDFSRAAEEMLRAVGGEAIRIKR